MYIIPFDVETLKAIVSGEISDVAVDYNGSKIKGKNLITYFSNLKNVSAKIDFTGVGLQEKFDLIEHYIKHQSTVSVKQLENTVVLCLLRYKNILVDEQIDSILTKEEADKFVSKELELIETLAKILDGTLLYAIKNLSKYKQEFGEFITHNIVAEQKEVGKTFVNLYQNELFNYHYYSKLPDMNNLEYYEHYYDRPIYSGQTLISKLQGNCVIYPFLKMILDVKYSLDDLTKIREEANAALV